MLELEVKNVLGRKKGEGRQQKTERERNKKEKYKPTHLIFFMTI